MFETVLTWLSKSMVLKRRATLGFEKNDGKHISVLNRLLSTETVDGVSCLTYEPDPRHAGTLAEQMGLKEGKSRVVKTPGEKKGDYYYTPGLEGVSARQYRSATMRLIYLAQDLPQIQYVAGTVAEHLAAPVVG